MLPTMPASRPLRLYAAAAVCLLLAVPAFWLDGTVASNGDGDVLPGDVRRLVSWSEMFAHGLGVVVIAGAVFALDRARRPLLGRALACAFGAGLLANVVKVLVARERPHHFDLTQAIGESFVGWLPPLTVTDWSHAVQSFPSAHTATAIGFAVGLSRLYPRARWLLAACALLASYQRIAAGAHFLSDVLAGAAVGFLAAAVFCDVLLAGRWFDGLERRFAGRPAAADIVSIRQPLSRKAS